MLCNKKSCKKEGFVLKILGFLIIISWLSFLTLMLFRIEEKFSQNAKDMGETSVFFAGKTNELNQKIEALQADSKVE